MNLSEYQTFCAQGVLPATKEVGEALIFGLGLAGEAGEVADIIKKVYGHGKPLDKDHLAEEIGDVMWYVANLCTTHGFLLEDILSKNTEKLRKRYPDMYETKNGYTCPKCGQHVIARMNSGPHIKISCASCGAFIKFEKQDKEDLPWKTK